MMMVKNDQELIEQAKEAISLGYEHIGRIETLTMTKDNIQEGSVSILMPDGALMDLNVLSEEQISAVKQHICKLLDESLDDSRKYLLRLNHQPAMLNPEFEAAVQEMTNPSPEETIREAVKESFGEEQPVPVPEPEVEPVIPEVIKKKPGGPKKTTAKEPIPEPEEAKQEEAAEPEVPLYPELDPEQVSRMYIDEGKNLQEVAAYFGKTKKELRDYIEKKRIFRPSKSPDGFRD